MSDASNRRTVFSVITGIISVVTPICVGFFLTPFIVKTLGEEANGFAQLANNFVMYASLLTTAFNSMGGRFISVSFHNEELEKARQYFSSLVLCNIVLTLILLLPGFFIVRYLDSLLAVETANVSDVKILFACIFLNFIVNQFTSLFSMSMFVRNKLYIQNILNLIRNLMNALLLLCAFSFLPARIYYVSAVALLLSIILFPCYYIIHRRILSSLAFRISDFRFSSLRELFKSGIWNTINQGAFVLLTGMDLLLADLFINPVSMGILSVSKTVPSFVSNLAGSLNSNLSPSITIAWAKKDNVRLLKDLRNSMKVSSILLATPIMLFCGFGVDFYQLWTPSLNARELAWLSFLACMHFIPMAGPNVLFNVFSAANKLQVNAISFLISGIINVAVVFFVLKSGYQYGIFAVAGVSGVLSVVRNLLVTLPYLAKILNLRWYEFYKDAGMSVLCSGLVLASVLLVKRFVVISGWFSLSIAVLLAAIMAVICEVFVLCNKEERMKLIQVIGDKIKRE